MVENGINTGHFRPSSQSFQNLQTVNFNQESRQKRTRTTTQPVDRRRYAAPRFPTSFNSRQYTKLPLHGRNWYCLADRRRYAAPRLPASSGNDRPASTFTRLPLNGKRPVSTCKPTTTTPTRRRCRIQITGVYLSMRRLING